ncbi:MFS transporter [Amycolatopsis sp. NPDC003865]
MPSPAPQPEGHLPKRRLRPGDVRIVDRPVLRRAVTGTIVGNVIEWYEFGVFGYLVTTMGAVFLPKSDPAVQSLYLFGTFAVTFLARPLGGIFFGWLGDRIGRRRTLTITLFVMAIATFATGLLPGYAVIGFWAPVLLVFLKLVQGFSASGEYTGGATFISEHAPDRRRGFYTGFMGTSYLGFALGAGLVALLELGLDHDEMVRFGWRLPFLIAAPLAGIAVYFRYRIEESPAFSDAAKNAFATDTKPDGVATVLKSQWRRILAVTGISAAGNVIAYTLTSYVPTYLTSSLGFGSTQGAAVTFPLYVVAAIGVQRFATLSDRLGRKPILFFGAAAGIVLPIPAFLLMAGGRPIEALLGTAFIALPAMVFSSSFAATLPAQFPTRARSSALGLSYNVGNAALGGTAPLVIAALIGTTGDKLIPAYYLIAAAVIGGVSVFFIRETARRPLPGSLPTAGSEAEAAELVRTQDDNPDLDLDAMPLSLADSSSAEPGNRAR